MEHGVIVLSVTASVTNVNVKEKLISVGSREMRTATINPGYAHAAWSQYIAAVFECTMYRSVETRMKIFILLGGLKSLSAS